jgi:hypothetical protein
VDFSVDDEFKKKYGHVHFIEYDNKRVQAPNPNSCMQHGGFLNALGCVGDEEVVIFTDADVDIQRGMTAEEILFFSKLADNEIAAGYNSSSSQTLLDEARHLQTLKTQEEIEAAFPESFSLKVYNTGVLAAKKKVYKNLYAQYIRDWGKVDCLFAHYAKQQFLISYLIQMNFKLKLIPDIIHTHAHYPVALRVKEQFGFKFCIRDKPVLFAHALHHITEDRQLACNHEQRTLEIQRLARKYQHCKCVAISLLLSLCILCGFCVFLLMK